MNFAHLFGQHHFETQVDAIAHYGAVWIPTVLIVLAVAVGLFIRIDTQKTITTTERKRIK